MMVVGEVGTGGAAARRAAAAVGITAATTRRDRARRAQRNTYSAHEDDTDWDDQEQPLPRHRFHAGQRRTTQDSIAGCALAAGMLPAILCCRLVAIYIPSNPPAFDCRACAGRAIVTCSCKLSRRARLGVGVAVTG